MGRPFAPFVLHLANIIGQPAQGEQEEMSAGMHGGRYLGHLISAFGVAMDPVKVSAVFAGLSHDL